MKLLFLIFSLCFSSFSLYAHERIIKGEKVSVGEGSAYTYVLYDSKNCVRSLGIALTKEALEGLPQVDSTYILKLPKGINLPPFKEVMLNWNAHGHEPIEIYGIPHFDFHFYSITDAERNAITCMDQDSAVCMKQPEVDYIPPYYIPTPAGVPMMGWHWLDSRSPELHGQRFTSTFIYGFYNAKIIFLEPMITREFLLGNGYVNAELSLPEKFAPKGYYPKNYVVKYDSEMKIYRVVLKNLTKMD